jgi:hypothetical protein
MVKVLTVLGVLTLGVAAYVWTRTGTFHVERTITIYAPPELVAPLLTDFHRWSEWSPWEKRDPAMRKTYTGDSYSWSGNRQAGSGSMIFLERTPSKVRIKLAFKAPFDSEALSTFTLAPKWDSTQVTWSLDGGGEDFKSKAAVAFMNVDKEIGRDFEQGLASLKAEVEMPGAEP